ncbi:MAG TPA: hypothetical protein PLE74_00935 [Candidatus Cloacimonadota bacterium]|nr:hypothetical protein [Candidatus Cloacimonadota bacterium]
MKSGIMELINKLERVNRKLKRLESYLNKRGNDILQERHFRLYKEKRLLLKHISIELN